MSKFSLNKKGTLVQLRSERPLSLLSKAISVSVLLNKSKGSLAEAFLFKQQLARFGFLVATPTRAGRRLVSFSRFFTLSDLCKAGTAFSQFSQFFCFLCTHRSTLVRPLGIVLGTRAFSLQEGVRWLNKLSLAWVRPRVCILLNPVRIFLLLLQVLLSRPIFVLTAGLSTSRRLRSNLWYHAYADNVALAPLIFDESFFLQWVKIISNCTPHN